MTGGVSTWMDDHLQTEAVIFYILSKSFFSHYHSFSLVLKLGKACIFEMSYNLTRALCATSERHRRLGASRLFEDDTIRNSLRASDPRSYEANKTVAMKAQKKC